LKGDAQALPFDDDSYDRVISAIGHMFAPDHQRNRRRDAPCLPPEWTHRDRLLGRPRATSAGCSSASAGFSPAPPEGFQSPLLWGTEGHVRELLGDAVEFEATRRRVSMNYRPKAMPTSC